MLRTSVRGFNLIELMVSIVIGMLVIAGATSLIVNINSSNANTVQSARLTQELRATLQLIADDLRRARRLNDPFAEIGKGALALANGTTYFGAYDPISSPAVGCILYTYQGRETNTLGATSVDHSEAQDDYQDAAASGATQVRAVTNDRAIYRATDAGGLGSVVLASAVSDPLTGNTAAARALTVDCTTAGTTLSSNQVDITALTFAPVTPSVNVADGTIAITLQGRFRNRVGGENLAVTRTVIQTVNIRSTKSGG